MKITPYELNIERIIALLLVFVLSTSAFFIMLFFPVLNSIVKQVLLYFGFFGYGFVVLSILVYYTLRANEWLNKDKMRLIVAIAIVLALSHASFTGFGDKSLWKFLGYLAGDGLIIVIGILTYKKWGNKKQNSKKLK